MGGFLIGFWVDGVWPTINIDTPPSDSEWFWVFYYSILTRLSLEEFLESMDCYLYEGDYYYFYWVLVVVVGPNISSLVNGGGDKDISLRLAYWIFNLTNNF